MARSNYGHTHFAIGLNYSRCVLGIKYSGATDDDDSVTDNALEFGMVRLRAKHIIDVVIINICRLPSSVGRGYQNIYHTYTSRGVCPSSSSSSLSEPSVVSSFLMGFSIIFLDIPKSCVLLVAQTEMEET